MGRIAAIIVAAAVAAFSGNALAQQPIDFAQVGIKTIDLGKNTYRLEGAGRQHHGRGRHRRHHRRRQPVRTALRQDQGGDHGDLAAAREVSRSPRTITAIIPAASSASRTTARSAWRRTTSVSALPPERPTASPATRRRRGRRPASRSRPISAARTTVETGGRKALLTHVNNAHTDGDTFVYFADANVLATGDLMSNTKRYQSIDFANGGDIRGVIKAMDAMLAVANGRRRSSPATARRRPAPTSTNTRRCWSPRTSASRSSSTRARAKQRCWPRGR